MQSDTQNQQLSEKGRMALHWAKLGLCVFPVQNGTKDKLLAGGWQTVASNDLAQVEQWWTENSDANIGCNLAKSGLVAVDADIYKPECEFNAFMQGRNLPATLTQKSARGGFHLIFRAEDAAKYPGKLCEATEIKHNGYIMLAPSTFAGGIYTVENWAEPAPCPEWVSQRQASTFDAHTPLIPTNDPNPAAPITDERLVELICGSPANADHFNGKSVVDWSESYFPVLSALCLFSSDEEQVRRVVMASPLVQNSPPKGSETRQQKVARLWAAEYPKAARRGAQERQQAAQAAAHGAQFVAGIGQPALGTTGDGLLSLVEMRTKFENEPPQAFVIERRIPDGEATLLSGDGGTGKTYLMQQVAVYVGTGSGEIIGKVDRVSPVIIWTAEDTLAILNERFQHIEKSRYIASCGQWAAQSLANIKCRDVLGAALWVVDRDNPAGKPTPAMAALVADIRATSARLVVLDNASNLFQANPNDPVQVTAFATELRRIARENHCAIVLLAHVNAETASTKFGPINKTYSGTVAWNNAFRSRMFIRKVPAENGVPEHVVVSHEKTNYGALAEPVRLKRNPENGVLSSLSNHEIADAIDESLSPFVEQVFTHIELAHKRGEPIRTSLTGSRNFYQCLAEMFGRDYPDGDKETRRKVRVSIERLFASGRIAKLKEWKNGNNFQSWGVLQPDDPRYGKGA